MARFLHLAWALLLGGCSLIAGPFSLSGTITIAAPLQNKLPRNNSVLFVVAKNQGGVPVAVRRIVNPQFPVSFSLGQEDLLVPGSRPQGPLSLHVQMNTHGNVGKPIKGDLEGKLPDPVRAGERGIHVVIDREV
ncbi:MAG: hypothetical protein HY921_11655 [Elusimicrobia bacterium]|nr:hypothetical protein [Elusimicrobiota bacterium]